jgi:alpha-mannosidase
MAVTSVHVVPHTHWDREWYRPFQGFRLRLVDVVDRVLELLDADPGFAFTLDGQMAMVDDYLEIRPEAASPIRRHVASGQLAIGPWQILPDEFLVSGESLVRNLEIGWRRADELGGPMRVGYLPDMFGHVAQLPQILRRAGLTDAVVWRGVPAAVDRHAFRWESPDGSALRAEYLVDGYDNAALLLAAPDGPDAVARLVDAGRTWFGTDSVLAMAGTDHSAPVASRSLQAAGVRVGTLPDYLADNAPLAPDAPRWRGELRSGARANLLMGVASARIDLKRAAAHAERWLERYAEPLTALHVAADDWPETFLRLAWRRAIESSAHDSIGGCSIDPVVDEVLVRFAEAEQIASGLAHRAAAAVATAVPRGSLAVLNPSSAARTGLVEAEPLVPDAWEEVALELPDGRRVATQELARKAPALLETDLRGDQAEDLFRRFHGREVFDRAWNGYRIDGRTLTLEVDADPEPSWLDVEGLRAEITATMRAAPAETWRIRIVARPRRTLLASVPAPALGWTTARPVEGRGKLADVVRVAPDGRSIANGLVSITVADDGTLRVEATDGTVADGVGRIVDGGDFGDSYNHAPPSVDRIVDEPRTVAVRAELDGPVLGRVVVDRTYDWPVALDADGSRRTAETVRTEARTIVELRADEPFVRIGLAFKNHSTDHRVRFVATLPRPAIASHAEGQFAVVERGLTAEGGYREEPLPTYPARGWVDAGGLAILLDHVTEYELTDGGHELALTVVRSIGLLSRRANPYRLDPAGPELPIPNAQLPGMWRMGFGLLVHAGDWASGGVTDAAERYAHGFLIAPGTSQRVPGPPDGADTDTLALDGPNVVLTSLRRRAGGWLEARVVNLAAEPVVATLRCAVAEAREASLRGEPGQPLATAGGELALQLGPAEIRTVQLRRRSDATRRVPPPDAVGPRQ